MTIPIKKELFTCPKCGCESTEIDDYQFDVDCLWMKVYCNECNESWSEYAKLEYDGYAKDGKTYDAEGNEIEL